LAGVSSWRDRQQQSKQSSLSQFGDPATYTAAATTQAGDYDKIMAQYDDLVKSYTNPTTAQAKYNPITQKLQDYNQSEDVTKSLADLSNLATTGGYSEADIANIRERDISPTRSIYANAQQNVERQRALSGGYSPNFGAVQAKMAREEADKIGDITTSANAGIAQNVAANKLASSSAYAAESGRASAAKTAVDQHNADIVNQINEFNTQNQLDTERFNIQNTSANREGVQSTLRGKTSLYGTTPALTKTFGDQTTEATKLGQDQQQINNQRRRDIFGYAGRG
jgi:hypothetical protein